MQSAANSPSPAAMSPKLMRTAENYTLRCMQAEMFAGSRVQIYPLPFSHQAPLDVYTDFLLNALMDENH